MVIPSGVASPVDHPVDRRRRVYTRTYTFCATIPAGDERRLCIFVACPARFSGILRYYCIPFVDARHRGEDARNNGEGSFSKRFILDVAYSVLDISAKSLLISDERIGVAFNIFRPSVRRGGKFSAVPGGIPEVGIRDFQDDSSRKGSSTSLFEQPPLTLLNGTNARQGGLK